MSDEERNATHQVGHAVLIYLTLSDGPHNLHEMRAISSAIVKRDEIEQLPYNLNLSRATDSRKSRVAIALGGLAAESAFMGLHPGKPDIQAELQRHDCSEWANRMEDFADWLGEAEQAFDKVDRPKIEQLIRRLQKGGKVTYGDVGNAFLPLPPPKKSA